MLDQLVGDVAGADRQIAARPEMPAPELPFQVRELAQQQARADPLQSLHDLADVLRRPIGDEQVDMVARDLAGDDVDLVLDRYLPDDVTRPNRHLPGQHPLAVLRHPDQVHLQIRLGVSAELITSHGDTITLRFA